MQNREYIKHASPRPWDVQNKGNYDGPSARHEVVVGINLDGSKNLPTVCKMPDLSDKSYGNAALIVTAVNVHDELLAACEMAAEFYHEATDDEVCTEENLCFYCAAIAKAKGAV